MKIVGIIHGAGVWDGNQRELLRDNMISFKDCIGTRDDIFLLLMEKGVEKKEAYEIMESVRKGKGVNIVQEKIILDHGIKECYLGIFRKIKSLLSKAHVASYTLLAWQLAYYREYYPEQFAEIIFN